MGIIQDLSQQVLNKVRDLAQRTERAFKSRAPRVPLADLHDIKIEYENETNGEKSYLKALNISTTGVAIEKKSLPLDLKAGDLLQFKIFVAHDSFALNSKVVQLRESSIALVYLEPTEEFVRCLQNYFEAEISALNVVYVNPLMLKPVENGESHWIQGNNNCGLYWISTRNDKVLRFELSFLGYRWDGSKEKGCTFYQAFGSENKTPLRKGCPPDMQLLAKKILNHMPCLEEPYRQSIFSIISS